jgi:hypothetical protein
MEGVLTFIWLDSDLLCDLGQTLSLSGSHSQLAWELPNPSCILESLGELLKVACPWLPLRHDASLQGTLPGPRPVPVCGPKNIPAVPLGP